jgi:hypothetical protein
MSLDHFTLAKCTSILTLGRFTRYPRYVEVTHNTPPTLRLRQQQKDNTFFFFFNNNNNTNSGIVLAVIALEFP